MANHLTDEYLGYLIAIYPPDKPDGTWSATIIEPESLLPLETSTPLAAAGLSEIRALVEGIIESAHDGHATRQDAHDRAPIHG